MYSRTAFGSDHELKTFLKGNLASHQGWVGLCLAFFKKIVFWRSELVSWTKQLSSDKCGLHTILTGYVYWNSTFIDQNFVCMDGSFYRVNVLIVAKQRWFAKKTVFLDRSPVYSFTAISTSCLATCCCLPRKQHSAQKYYAKREKCATDLLKICLRKTLVDALDTFQH